MLGVNRTAMVVFVTVLVAAGLVGCGDDDDAVSTDDPLVQAIADDVLADEEDEDDPLFGSRDNAECFGVEVVESVGSDRLAELGFTATNVPDEFQADWNSDEIDSIIDALDGCVDMAAFTRTLFQEQDEAAVDCILDEVGDKVWLDIIRATFESEEAAEQEFARVQTAAENCGVSLD